MVVLDTDHMSVLERRDQPESAALRARLASLPSEEVVTTIVSRGLSSAYPMASLTVQRIELCTPLNFYVWFVKY
jgi:hypothetical protein